MCLFVVVGISFSIGILGKVVAIVTSCFEYNYVEDDNHVEAKREL